MVMFLRAAFYTIQQHSKFYKQNEAIFCNAINFWINVSYGFFLVIINVLCVIDFCQSFKDFNF